MHHVRTWLICLLLALTGCATTIETAPRRLEMQQPKALRMVQEADKQAVATQEPMQTMFDVEPVEDNVLATILEGFQSAEWLPYENGRAPPVNVAQVTTNPIVTGVCPPEFQGPTGVTGQVGNCEMPSFVAALQTSLVPGIAQGSPTATFTRATTAYQTDFEGKQNLALSGEARMQGARRVANRLTFTETFSNAAWATTGAGTTKTTGVTDRVGGTAAVLVTAGAADSGFKQDFATVAGNKYVLSFWYKSASALNLNWFDGTAYVQQIALPTVNSWQRVSYASGTIGTGGSGFVVWGGFSTFSTGETFTMAFPEIEDVTGQANQNPSEYVSVGVLSAPFHGANVDGVKYFDTLNGNTVASNVVTEATGAAIRAGVAGVAATAPVDASGPYGYLAEGARADVLGTTAAIRRTMSDVGWVNGGTMTVGAATGVDGVASAAASLTGGAVTATNTVLFTTVLGAAVRTYSAWIRRKTGTGTIEMTKDGGVSWTDITSSVAAAYKQVQVVTASAANPVVGFRITTNTDAIEVDFNTLEAATFANPTPIPVNVSKAADVLTYPSAGNISGTQGAVYAEVTIPTTAIGGNPRVIGSGAGAGAPIILSGTTSVPSIFDGAAIPASGLSALTVGAVNKLASSWGGATAYVAENGTASAALSIDGDISIVSTINIGNGNGADQPFGTIRNVRIYPTALPSARLTTITTDAMYWLLPENWAVAANDAQYRIAANQ